MSGSDFPRRVLSRTFMIIWVFAIVLLLSSAILHSLGEASGSEVVEERELSVLLVQAFLILIPLGLLAFAGVMIVKREWTYGLTGLLLSLIWVGAKRLG